jgi:hypothetical protein
MGRPVVNDAALVPPVRRSVFRAKRKAQRNAHLKFALLSTCGVVGLF